MANTVQELADKLVIFNNFKARMEYNERSGHWKLSGSITDAERDALVIAGHALRNAVSKAQRGDSDA